MERKVRRIKNLPSFRIDLGELESLMNKLLVLFGNNKLLCCHIKVNLKNEEFTFRSVDEMRSFKGLPEYITSFNIFILADSAIYSINIYSSSGLSPQPKIIAESDNEAWCAGAIEVVYQFAQPHRIWYDRFYGWPLNVFMPIYAFSPIMIKTLKLTSTSGSLSFIITWFIGYVLVFALFFARHRLLPGAIIVTTSKENIWRRYAPEITLIIALLSLLASVAGLFIKK